MSTPVFKGRNTGLDVLKYALSFLVICIHMPYPFHEYTEPVFRLAIPLFALITGYYYEDTVRTGKTIPQIRKIAILFVVSLLVYYLWDLVGYFRAGLPVSSYLGYYLSLSSVAKLLVFNAPMTGGHLWYLGALLYSLILLWMADRLHVREKLYPLIPILLLIHLFLGTYSAVLFHRRLPVLLTRNHLFFILPFLLLGDWLRKRSTFPSNRCLWITVAGSVVCILLEAAFLRSTAPEFNQEFFIGTTFLSCSIFLLVLGNPHWFQGNVFSLFAVLGRRTSTIVYIIHYFVMGLAETLILQSAAKYPLLPTAYGRFGPWIVLVLATAIAWLITAPAFSFRKPIQKNT